MFAILKAVIHFKQILYNCKIFISTDSQNLINEGSNINRRVNRWKICLSEFDITFKHVQGNENIPADSLSRNFCTKIEEIDKETDKEWVKRRHQELIHPSSKKMERKVRY